MTFDEFCSKSYSEKSVFQRKQFDFSTNVVKWFAMRFAYGLYRLGLSANIVDVIGMLLVLGGFFLLASASPENRYVPLLGIVVIYFYVFLDFVDGPIAKSRGACSMIGSAFDNIGCDLSRVALLVLLGIYTGSDRFLLANLFAGVVLFFFVPATMKEVSRQGLAGVVCRFLIHKFSLIGVRFMLVVLPFVLGVLICRGESLAAVARFFSVLYLAAAGLWIAACLQNERP